MCLSKTNRPKILIHKQIKIQFYKSFLFIIFVLGINLSYADNPDSFSDFSINSKEYVVGNQKVSLEIHLLNPEGLLQAENQDSLQVQVNQKTYGVRFQNGSAVLEIPINRSQNLQVQIQNKTQKIAIRHIPGWLSLLPPLVAIVMALIFREVIVSLFTGIFLGVLIIKGFSWMNLGKAFLAVADTYLLGAFYDTGHLSIILFTSIIGGLVAIISKNGGMTGVINLLSPLANSVRNTQLVTWFMGVAIFFDDYANTLIVGNTMRPFSDKFKISREKLAYIVDSTSAPVASIAFVTTWIGAELGYIKEAALQIGLNEGAYSIFLNSLQYSYYPVFALIFMFFIIYTQRDFGAMFRAEKRARETGELNAPSSKNVKIKHQEADVFTPVANAPFRWINAFIPISLVVLVTMIGLLYTGWETTVQQMAEANATEEQLQDAWNNLSMVNEGEEPSFVRKVGILLGNADSYITLIWGSFVGLVVAILLTISQRIMNLRQTMETMASGFNSILQAILILLFAWALTKVNADLQTATYLKDLVQDGISPAWFPTMVFILAGFVAFATGSSWGTMAILYPLLLSTTWETCQNAGMDLVATQEVFYHVAAAVLAGSVFGDHCSPISDTTIMSSLASGTNHIEHVRTQLPYALTVGFVSMFASLILFNIGLPFYINFLIGGGILYLIVRFLGKKV